MKNNTLNKLKSDYEELEIKPSVDIWNRLDQKLIEIPETDLKPSFQWWKYAAVILLLISVGTIIFFNTDKNKFNDKEINLTVKKVPEKTIYPINPEFENIIVMPINESVGDDVKAFVENRKSNGKDVIKEEIQLQISEFKPQQIAFKQENIDIKPIEINNTIIPNSPVIAEAKKIKTSYINANELLLGREFEKTKENPYKDEIKFGVFNFDKPKVENVTVLGVSVYIDSK